MMPIYDLDRVNDLDDLRVIKIFNDALRIGENGVFGRAAGFGSRGHLLISSFLILS